MRERPSEFIELFRRAVHFHSGEIGDLEHFREQYAYVVEMSEDVVGVYVTFAAENFIAVDAKAVEKVLSLNRSFLDEPRKASFNGLEFSGMNFEIRVKTDEICLHIPNVRFAAKRVDDLLRQPPML